MSASLAASRALCAALVLGLCTCSRVPSDPTSTPGTGAASPSLRAPAAPAPTPLSAPPLSASAPIPAPRIESPTWLAGGAESVASQYGLVVAVEERAARAGAAVLEQGGNAVDAAIATLFALTVTHPSAASLGGEGFALVRPSSGPTAALDFIARAPAGLTREGFVKMITAQARGAAAVGVPGVVAGIAALHARFATRPLAELVAPALTLARDGYPLGAWQAELVRRNFAALKSEPASRAVFAENGRARNAQRRFKQPDLAWTLERIAQFGADDFYRGAVAERLAKALAKEGPSLADLNQYQALWRAPVNIRYRDFTLETMPPPSAGGVALVGALLALQAVPSQTPGSAADVHVLLEAERRGQAERRLSVLDPEALPEAEQQARQARWLDPAFWSRVPIDPSRATPSAAVSPLASAPAVESEHTTHLSVTDRSGMVVSLTTTLCASFGAKFVASGTGVVLNNAVATFSSSGDNRPTPGRRTTSSMAPSLLLSAERAVAVLGTPGGDTIPSTLTQLVRHLVDERMPLDRAIQAPRWHHGFLPDEARYETSAGNPQLLQELQQFGHHTRAYGRKMGDANCIVLDGERAYGYADTREPGVAIAATR